MTIRFQAGDQATVAHIMTIGAFQGRRLTWNTCECWDPCPMDVLLRRLIPCQQQKSLVLLPAILVAFDAVS